MQKKRKKCTVFTRDGKSEGIVIRQYEEIGGADDGAIFALIELDNGKVITVKMSKIELQT
jgi:hypothetical protein